MSTQQFTETEAPGTGDTGSIGQAIGDYWQRVRGGDVGSLPAVLGLVALVALFSVLEGDTFFTPLNFANLLNQGTAIIILAMGLVFVLLLGEIDLSAGFAAGTTAAILAVTLTHWGWAWPLALLASLATGAVIGLVLGVLVARLGIPSFVVTLAAFLGLQGVMLLVIGEGGTIPINSDAILFIMNKNMPVWAGWLLWAVVILGYLASALMAVARRAKAGLPATSTAVLIAKTVSLAVLLGGAVYLLNLQRQIVRSGKHACGPDEVYGCVPVIQGVPWAVVLVLVLLVILSFVTSRTAFGRHIYAVGGNAEAARRAGISVPRIRISAFVINSTMAAVAGLALASRDHSVSPTTGGAQTLLFAVGAAVIGGTSLFGGRGKVRDAVVGGLVVAVIANGLPLITSQSGIQFVVTGGVLLIAASVDAISRRRASAAGR